jgi:hypothetical protein
MPLHAGACDACDDDGGGGAHFHSTSMKAFSFSHSVCWVTEPPSAETESAAKQN